MRNVGLFRRWSFKPRARIGKKSPERPNNKENQTIGLEARIWKFTESDYDPRRSIDVVTWYHSARKCARRSQTSLINLRIPTEVGEGKERIQLANQDVSGNQSSGGTWNNMSSLRCPDLRSDMPGNPCEITVHVFRDRNAVRCFRGIVERKVGA